MAYIKAAAIGVCATFGAFVLAYTFHVLIADVPFISFLLN